MPANMTSGEGRCGEGDESLDDDSVICGELRGSGEAFVEVSVSIVGADA